MMFEIEAMVKHIIYKDLITTDRIEKLGLSHNELMQLWLEEMKNIKNDIINEPKDI
jgi:hypothetical protein